jgi:hypothetical protein
MGTAGYAPPEQYAGQGQTTPRSDIYGLGVTLHEMLTGDDPTARPFVFTSPHELKPGVASSVSNVVMRALRMDPGDRFASAREMKEALEKATVPRRLRLPSFQRQKGTGTTVLPSAATDAAAASFWQRQPVKTVWNTIRWTGRIVIPILFVLIIVALLLVIGGSYVLSAIAERTIATTEWGFENSDAELYILTEQDLSRGMAEAVEFYALDAIGDIRADFRSPDTAIVFMELGSNEYSLEVRVEYKDGTPVVMLEKLNSTPLYIVGGIISGGINRGFEKAWEDSSVRITDLEIESTQLSIWLER